MLGDICRYTASLTIGFSDHKESLADFRLALLDHTSCGKKDDPTDIANAWDNTISMDSERDIKEFMSLEGPLLLSASGLLNPHSYERGNNQQNIDTIFTDEEDIDLKSQDELCNQTGLYVYNCGTKDYSFYSNSDSSGPKPDKYIYKEENGNHSNTKSEEIKSQALGRKRPVKLDHSIRQEMERQRLAEESRARAVNMYSKLQSSRPTAIRTAQSMSISRFEDFDFLAKYCIFSQEKLAEYKRAFEAVDTDEDGYLDCLQVLMALKEIVPENALSDAEELYVYRILEIVDYYVTDGLTDLRLFAVMASLAQKIAALDSFMRSLIDHMDFKALELKMCKAKQLFLCNIDAESKSISVEQLLVELKAGGISREHEEAAQLELSHIKKLDILDFLTYLPLFVLIHNSVIANPLDDSRKI
ncbi:uncharacterized protein LOC142150791 [Mixophyes fleayi]|uniref:uncharacterized protein LOC142150791 n=1 Tax=Mixophyes fleayi TaxID=3061075 RepID=UPI003F4E1F91